jgi:hypothetical protein
VGLGVGVAGADGDGLGRVRVGAGAFERADLALRDVKARRPAPAGAVSPVPRGLRRSVRRGPRARRARRRGGRHLSVTTRQGGSARVVGGGSENEPVSSLYRDDAVVLRTQKLGEADRIVTLLTRENGRGARGGQGRAQDDVPVRLAAGAVHADRRPALRRAARWTR